LHPPLPLAVPSHVAYSASTATCVWHAATVKSEAQVNTTAGAAVTVNVALQVVVIGAQLLV